MKFNRHSGSKADLSRADLSGADLTHADLALANLRGVHLDSADLSGADLWGATLTNARLFGAKLTKAFLVFADLRGTDLRYTDLTGAYLLGAQLMGADLDHANLTGAFLGGANLRRTRFEPIALPELQGIAASQNLQLLTYENNPSAIVQFRKQFQDGGFREQERKITYALKRREADLSGPIWKWFNKVVFDWTCQYGMSPGRPLAIVGSLWLLFSLVYFGCIYAPGKAGLYWIYGERIYEKSSKPRDAERISSVGTARSRSLRWFGHECLLLLIAMLFSLMSAFNIGFRDINFGRVLRLMMPKEFDIKAEGWPRTIAGVQSVISVSMIALWVLTYFGRPFG